MRGTWAGQFTEIWPEITHGDLPVVSLEDDDDEEVDAKSNQGRDLGMQDHAADAALVPQPDVEPARNLRDRRESVARRRRRRRSRAMNAPALAATSRSRSQRMTPTAPRKNTPRATFNFARKREKKFGCFFVVYFGVFVLFLVF